MEYDEVKSVAAGRRPHRRVRGVGGVAGCSAGAALLPGQLQIPVDYYKLTNGLKVVMSRDTTAPTAVVAVYYNIGFRIEPKDRTGFAHLFEHLMFQGSQNLGKMEFIKLVESNGGILNGSTRFDFTNYFQVVPSHGSRPILWAEADRMRGLADHAGQPEEPAGGGQERSQGQRAEPALRRVPLDRPADGREHQLVQRAQLLRRPEHLDAATLEDVAAFFKTFYAPNNAVLVVAGDFDADQRSLDREVLRRHSVLEAAAAARSHRAAAGEGEARRPDRCAREPAGARLRLPRARPRHAGVVRLRPASIRSWLRGATRCSTTSSCASGRADRRASTRASTGGSAACSTTAGRCCGWRFFHDSDKADRLLLTAIDAEIERCATTGGPGDARPGAREAALAALRRHRAVRGLRQREPAGLLRPLRRRPGADQPARGRVREGDARPVQKTAQEYLRPRTGRST